MFLFMLDVPFCADDLRADCRMGYGARLAGVGPPLVGDPENEFLWGEPRFG